MNVSLSLYIFQELYINRGLELQTNKSLDMGGWSPLLDVRFSYVLDNTGRSTGSLPFHRISFCRIPFCRIRFRRIRFRRILFRRIPFRRILFHRIPFCKILFRRILFCRILFRRITYIDQICILTNVYYLYIYILTTLYRTLIIDHCIMYIDPYIMCIYNLYLYSINL